MAVLTPGRERAATRPPQVRAPAHIRVRGSAWLRWGFVLGLAVVSGLVVARLAPRGPVTAWQAIGLTALALVTGLIAGRVSRSRWAMLVAPQAHLAAFELGRLGVVGPTVGAVRLDGMFQVLAVISGRGMYVLVALLPMALGAILGATLARRGAQGTPRSRGVVASASLMARQFGSC